MTSTTSRYRRTRRRVGKNGRTPEEWDRIVEAIAAAGEPASVAALRLGVTGEAVSYQMRQRGYVGLMYVEWVLRNDAALAALTEETR